ncbi:MAG TPA: hypothetical protein VHM88_01270, partial [Candidatus Acidoferrales bacterium]|nr:hypothetical protein [Candidatus Acidoferrales bacterium]
HLLDYAVLKALCEKLLVASVERRGSQVAVKFHPQTPLLPEQLVRVVGGRPGLRLDPGGVLWMSLDHGKRNMVQDVRNVLLQLQA